MTITLRPLHLAIVAAFVLGLLGGGILLASGDGDSPQPTVFTSPEGVDEAPTATPEPSPTATAEPTEEPVEEPTPEPEPTAAIRTCDEIEADGSYNSPEERDFFLANCTTSAPATSQPEPTTAPPTTSGPTQEEQSYRGRAQGMILHLAAQIDRYYGTPSTGAVNDILEYGAIFRNFAYQMDDLRPVPARFQRAHDQLQIALLNFADFLLVVRNLETEAEVNAWAVQASYYYDALILAFDDYRLVVGTDSN